MKIIGKIIAVSPLTQVNITDTRTVDHRIITVEANDPLDKMSVDIDLISVLAKEDLRPGNWIYADCLIRRLTNSANMAINGIAAIKLTIMTQEEIKKIGN